MTAKLEERCSVQNPFSNRDAQSDRIADVAAGSDDLVKAVLRNINGLDWCGFDWDAQVLTEAMNNGPVSWIWDDYFSKTEKHRQFLVTNVSVYPPLSPSQIKNVVDGIKPTEDLQHSGLFVSGLIQRSYESGHNNFLFTNCGELDCFASYLRGTPQKPIRIRILGDVAGDFLGRSWHCHAEVQGDAGHSCGALTRKCNIVVHGGFGSHGGWCARHINMTVGDAYEYFGYWARHSIFTAESASGFIGVGAKHCRFNIRKFGSESTHFDTTESSHNTYCVPHDLYDKCREDVGLKDALGRLLNATWYRNRVEELP